jgi:hypothetical protein
MLIDFDPIRLIHSSQREFHHINSNFSQNLLNVHHSDICNTAVIKQTSRLLNKILKHLFV